jgi:hypothetical protein
VQFKKSSNKRGFKVTYKPLLERFLQAREGKEANREVSSSKGTNLLSIHIRHAIEISWEIDAVYWGALRKPEDESVEEDLGKEMEFSVETKI